MNEEHLFLGFSLKAPWPEELPQGRIAANEARHLTVAFLGSLPFEKFAPLLDSMPKPDWKVAAVGIMDELLFLPSHHPRVVATNIRCQKDHNPLLSYHQELIHFIREHSIQVDHREFLPHVSLARAPFYPGEWRAIFHPIPFFTTALHLYQSFGDSRYEILWSFEIPPPFKEIEHQADVAFHVFGVDAREIHLNALIALSFFDPRLIPYLEWDQLLTDIPSIVSSLNAMVSRADGEVGVSLKAVSYHGEIIQGESDLLTWEMICDV